MHQITKVSPKTAGSPPSPQRLNAVHFTPNASENAEQIASIIPREIKGFLAGSNTPNNAGSVIPTTAIREADMDVVFILLFLVLNHTPNAAPPIAIFPYASNGKK